MRSNNVDLLVLAVVFIVGAILFALGTFLVRRQRATPDNETAPVLSGRADKLEMIERLAIVGQPWCVDELRKIIASDPDRVVRDAAEDALLVIGARGA